MTLSVMSFNIRVGAADDGPNAWPHRRSYVRQIITAHAASFVCLQEALDYQIDYLSSQCPDYEWVGLGREDGTAKEEQSGEHVPIFYDARDYHLLASDTLWFSNESQRPGSRSWGNTLPRILTWGLFRDKKTQQAFYIYNVHLDHASAQSRLKSAEMLERVILTRNENTLPFIICGDFNAGENSPPVLHLKNSVALSLRDTYRDRHPHTQLIGTFNGFEGKCDGEKIDHILVSDGFSIEGADILRNDFEGRYPSDHFPILAHLQAPVTL